MHELAISRSIVAAVEPKLGALRARRVVVDVGRLSGVVPEALALCFEVCARNTAVEGAELDIREIPGLARCGACAAEVELSEPIGLCDCGSGTLDIVRGRELRIREVEVH